MACDWQLDEVDVLPWILQYLREFEEETHRSLDETAPRNLRLANAIEEMFVEDEMTELLNITDISSTMKHRVEQAKHPNLTPRMQRIYAKRVAQFMFESVVFKERLEEYWTDKVTALEEQTKFFDQELRYTAHRTMYCKIIQGMRGRTKERLAEIEHYPQLVNKGMHDHSFASRDASPERK